MKYVFDLKGTTLNRYTMPLAHKKRTLKDKNFEIMNNKKQVFIYIYIYVPIYIVN